MKIDIKKLDEPGVITTHILRNWDKEKIERFVRYFEGRVSSEVQPMVMPGGEDEKGKDCTAREYKELKELIRDILPFCRLDEAEEWVEPLLKKHGI